ncbi:MAG: tRNA-dihydrouridine synthase family protein [Chitinispirillaceae bacterium]|nr:tRNA-dihydrouridine synthase family protein [Chitinispirillaceae bacterium]
MQLLLFLAPLRGVTDHIFRAAFERCFGRFDYMLTPFITTVKGRGIAPSHIKDVTGEENDRLRLIPQILGNDPDDFLLLARHLHALGYQSINWNLGCPHPQVTRKKRGCGLLPYPEFIARFLERVIPALPGPLSIKVRLGLDDGDELKRLMPVLNRFPLSNVIIHPRTGRQGYSGSVDLDRFETAADLCRHPVVYNGDIASIDDFRDRRGRFPQISRWMIGRGVARNPFLLESIRNGHNRHVDYIVLRDFHDELFARNGVLLHGPAHLLGRMKEFWAYFSGNFQKSHDVLMSIQRCITIEMYRRKVDEAFARRGAV